MLRNEFPELMRKIKEELAEIVENMANEPIGHNHYISDGSYWYRPSRGDFTITDPVNQTSNYFQFKAEKHPMDEKYPHICFKCKKELEYLHAKIKALNKDFTEEQFKKLWKSNVIEFYCCTCYNEEFPTKNVREVLEDILTIEDLERIVSNMRSD